MLMKSCKQRKAGKRRTIGEVPGVCAIVGGVLALVEGMRGLSASRKHCLRASCVEGLGLGIGP